MSQVASMDRFGAFLRGRWAASAPIDRSPLLLASLEWEDPTESFRRRSGWLGSRREADLPLGAPRASCWAGGHEGLPLELASAESAGCPG
jgi:hypothetical protein